MKRWFLLKATGEVLEMALTWKPSLENLQGAVGGMVELVRLDGRTELWCNEEGKLIGLALNHTATNIWHFFYGPTDMVVGDVLLAIGARTRRNQAVLDGFAARRAS